MTSGAATARSDHERRLRVEFRRRSPDSSIETPMVFCAREGQDVPLLACSQCSHCGGLEIDSTERGTFLRCRAEPPRREPVPARTGRPAHETVTIGQLMTQAVCSVTPNTSIGSLVALLLEKGISAVPVVDAEGKAIGIVSKTDLLRRYYDDAGSGESLPSTLRTSDGIDLDLGPGFHALQTGELDVSEVMTRRPFHLPQDATVGHAAAVMAYEGVHRLVVTTQTGKIAGILSALDILRWLACETGFVVPEVGHVRVTGDRNPP